MPWVGGRAPSSVLSGDYAVFNVKDYGAKCDATAAGSGTDDTSAIQAAIDAAELVNGTVYIPGRCKVTAALTVDASVTICGPGGAADTGTGAVGYCPRGQLITTSTTADVITVTGNSSTRNVHIHDLGINCATAYTSASHTSGAGIRLTNTISSFLERVTVFNKYDGIVVDGSGTTWAASFKDIEVALIKHDGVNFTHGSTVGGIGHVAIQDAQITNGNGTRMTGAGLRLNGVSGGSFENIDCIGCTTGIHIGDSVQSIYCYFRNCLGDTSTLPWRLQNCRLSEFDSCYAATLASDGGTRGVQMDTNAQDINWRGGTMGYFTTEGFYLDGCDNVSVTGTQFTSYSGVATASPFKLGASTTYVTIKDCNGRGDFTGAGVAAGASGHTYLWIEGNHFASAITGTVSGTGNVVQNNRVGSAYPSP